MPARKPRINVTETDELAAALMVARELWPNESKSVQVSLLVQRGAQAIVGEELASRIEWLETIEAVRMELGDMFKDLTIEKVRKVWER